jgi:glucoamylase
MPYIMALEKFANDGGMIAEQLWDADDLPDGKMIRGRASGSAMPLCWSHAEYLSLVCSHRDRKVFDRIEPAFQRYVVGASATARTKYGHSATAIAGCPPDERYG